MQKEQDGEFRYKRIFLYSSLQFSGHMEEYFSAHTEKLLVFVWMPRFKGVHSLVRLYERGRLVSEKPVRMPTFRPLWYAAWLALHWSLMFRSFTRSEPFILFGWSPFCFLGISVLRRFRRIRTAYGIGDYFLPLTFRQRAFNRLLTHYHRRADHAFYLSDAINRQLNGGTAVETADRRTVMWGVQPLDRPHAPPDQPFTLLFVGMINPSHGLPNLFRFLRSHPDWRTIVVGLCPEPLYREYQALITDGGLSCRVEFHNRFVRDEELREIARNCHVGMALYETGPRVHTHYADPGKVKSYMEMGLPVLMTNISGVVPYIRRFGSGEVIDSLDQFDEALTRIRSNYPAYVEGVRRMVQHFEFSRYYREGFAALESGRSGPLGR